MNSPASPKRSNRKTLVASADSMESPVIDAPVIDAPAIDAAVAGALTAMPPAAASPVTPSPVASMPVESSPVAAELPLPAELPASAAAAAAVMPDIAAIPAAATAGAEQVQRHAAKATYDFDLFGRETLSAFAESQAALARGLEAMTTEVAGLTRSGMAAATSTATAMLGVRTLAAAVELNAGYARSSFDALIGGSAKLSEIGVRLATEASRPLLSRFGEAWKSRSIGV